MMRFEIQHESIEVPKKMNQSLRNRYPAITDDEIWNTTRVYRGTKENESIFAK